MSEHFITFEQITRKVEKKKIRIELAHCPFCGGGALFRHGGNYDPKQNRRVGVGVYCTDCRIATPVRQRTGDCPEAVAAELWNRRAKA